MTYPLPGDFPIEIGGVPSGGSAPPPLPAAAPNEIGVPSGGGSAPPRRRRRYALPVRYGTITQVFGPTNEPLDRDGFNKGIDIGVEVGTPVFSVTDGEVIAVGDHGDGWGTSVWIRDAEGYIHQYGHLSKAQVQVGDRVTAGTQIALSGNTGASTGPHLSYDVRDPSGRYVDPSRWLGFNAAGDNRRGHPAIGRDIRDLAGDDDFTYSPAPRDGVEYVETNPPPAGWPRGYEQYLGARQRWNQLFYKFAPWALGDKGYAVTFDGENVYGIITDPETGASRRTPRPIATADEWREFMLLTRQLEEYENWLDSYYGPDAAEWYVKFADWVYQTSPEYIDYLNADRAFKERAQTVVEAANIALRQYEDYRDRQSKAIEQMELFRRDETVMTPVPNRVLRSWNDFFNEAFQQLSEKKGEPPKAPYYPEDVRRRAIERGMFEEPPPIPGQTAPPPAQQTEAPRYTSRPAPVSADVRRALDAPMPEPPPKFKGWADYWLWQSRQKKDKGEEGGGSAKWYDVLNPARAFGGEKSFQPQAWYEWVIPPLGFRKKKDQPSDEKQNRLPPVPSDTRRAMDQGSAAAATTQARQIPERPLTTLARGAYGNAYSMPAVRAGFLSLPTRQPQISTQLVMALRRQRRQQNGLVV